MRFNYIIFYNIICTVKSNLKIANFKSILFLLIYFEEVKLKILNISSILKVTSNDNTIIITNCLQKTCKALTDIYTTFICL